MAIWTATDVTTYFTDPTSKLSKMMSTDVLAPVYTHYQSVGVCVGNTDIYSGCSFSNLTYNQWFSGAVLKNPLPG